MRNIPKIMALVACTNLIASCSNSTNVADNSNSSSPSESVSSQNGNSTISSGNESNINSSDSITKKLSINDRCIGCGHCVREAASNFSMNSSTHKAEVISQNNSNSTDVSNAINRCPVSAISLS